MQLTEMASDDRHRRFMELALAEARRAAEREQVPVGAVAVRDGQVLAQAHNQVQTINDPTAHAELLVLREAAQAAGNYRLDGAELYVTLEPCLMCLGAMVHARIRGLYFAAADPKLGAARLLGRLMSRRRALNHRFEVHSGLLADESAALLRAFFRARR